jgi:AmmeMemoRadiSam system protein A
MDHLLDEPEQQRLLALARRALEARVRGEAPPAPDAGGALDLPRGAFVTLHHRGNLRGCLGRLDVRAPLSLTIAELAAVVSDSDARFDPVRSTELADLDIEISVLTPERVIASPDEIEVGRHGLIVEDGRHRGLLLPQVATEHGFDRQTFLEQACLKAGLPGDAWQQGATVQVFEAQVFGERRDTKIAAP